MIDKYRFPNQYNTTYESPRFRKLTSPFHYIDPVEGEIICKTGLLVDGASFGRFFMLLFGDQHDYDIPSAPHDQLYECNIVDGRYLTRKECDRVLYRAMMYAGFSQILASIFYFGVRIGGWISWNRNRKLDKKSTK